MKQTDTQFAGSIPAVYDRHLGPVIFGPFAVDLATRLAAAAPARVLEIAAGTGRVTRELARRLPAASIVATDLNQPMLDYASAQVGALNVAWQQADAQALPFSDASFDAVACQFGAMFFPDRPRAFAEARRVLAPGGRFVFSVWGPIETSDFALVVTETLTGLFGADATRFVARVPHGYCEAELIRRDLSAAGFGSIEIETVTLTSRATSAREPAVGFCEGTPLRNELEANHPGRLAEATAAAAAALEARFGAGPIEGSMQALLITAGR